jgi:murein DD-endopeptidase MepM/ murein hydrolase activator NlpD
MKYFLLIVLFSLNSFAYAQEDINELTIVDTSVFNDKKIYIFSDNSWVYAYKIKNISKYIENNNVEALIKNEAAFFKFNWLNNKSHVNVFNLSGLKDSFNLNIYPKGHLNYSTPIKLDNVRITSTFKYRWNRWHKGLDIGMKRGTKLYSCFDGIVRYAKFNKGGYGNLIIIRHYNGLETYYAHLDFINVKPNQKVSAGELIGLSGTAGTGPHLHFEVRIFGNAFNPYFLWDSNLKLIKKEIYISSRLFYHQTKKKTVTTNLIVGEKEKVKNSSPQKRTRTINNSYGTIK